MRLPLLLTAKRPTFDETGPAPLREADVDDIEVLRNNRLGEDRARLADDLRPEVAVRQMRQREHPHLRCLRKLGRRRRRGVQRLVGARALLLRERRLMHEDVSVSRGPEHGLAGARVAGDHYSPPRPRGPEHLLRADGRAVGELDGLAALQPAEERAFGHAEPTRFLEVEPAGTLRLDERVSLGGHTVLDGEGLDAVVGALDRLARLELGERQLIAQAPEHAPEDREQVAKARGSVHSERDLSAAEGERLQHPGEPEVVIGVVVGQEDLW